MHLISFDASPRQVSKIRNGHSVRVKRGRGFNLIVSPVNYHLVSRAFTKNKGIELKLTPEELDVNRTMSPEQHEAMSETVDENLFEHLPFSEGGSIFGSMKKMGRKVHKALHSKEAKAIGRELRPLSRALKRMGREIAHEKIADVHMAGADKYGDDPRIAELMNLTAGMAHEKVGGSLMKSLRRAGHKVHRALHSKEAKAIGREFRPLSRAIKKAGRDYAHEKIANAHMSAAEQYGEDPRMAELMNLTAGMAHEKVGSGLGAGFYPKVGWGMNAHEALLLANTATAHANHHLSKMHNATVHGQITQPPIRRYRDDALAPPSRGTGIHNHYNMIRGRGSLLSQDDILPPALQSQPYGANFHMQFFLPPEYRKYNDGGDMEGRGLYL